MTVEVVLQVERLIAFPPGEGEVKKS